MLEDHRIAAKNCLLTTRAAKWATVQVGGGRTVSEVAAELACDWHTVNDAVTTYGEALLTADRKRLNQTTAIGLDETSFVQARRLAATPATPPRWPTWRTTRSSTSSRPANTSTWRAGSTNSPRPGRSGSASAPSTCRPPTRRCTRSSCPRPPGGRPLPCSSRWPIAASTPSAAGCRTNRPGTGVEETIPLYRARRALLRGRREARRRSDRSACASLLELGDPGAEVAIAYRVKERLRDFYRASDPDEARQLLEELKATASRRAMPPEIQKLGRTIRDWFDKICNYHLARVSNGPTEALNNLIKRIKRIGFGFRNFENYRIRALLYAGRPNWRVLGSIVVR